MTGSDEVVRDLDRLALVEHGLLKPFKCPFVYGLHRSGRKKAVLLGQGCEGCLINNVPAANLKEEKCVSLVKAKGRGRRAP